MISILITLLVFLIIASLIWWVLGQLPLPPIVRTVAIVIMVVFAVIWLLQFLPGAGLHGLR